MCLLEVCAHEMVALKAKLYFYQGALVADRMAELCSAGVDLPDLVGAVALGGDELPGEQQLQSELGAIPLGGRRQAGDQLQAARQMAERLGMSRARSGSRAACSQEATASTSIPASA